MNRKPFILGAAIGLACAALGLAALCGVRLAGARPVIRSGRTEVPGEREDCRAAIIAMARENAALLDAAAGRAEAVRPTVNGVWRDGVHLRFSYAAVEEEYYRRDALL